MKWEILVPAMIIAIYTGLDTEIISVLKSGVASLILIAFAISDKGETQ